MTQNRSLVPSLLPATIESANESPLREQHNNNPPTTTTKQGTHVEAIRLQQLNRNMKRPSPHHIDHGVLYVFDAHSLGLCNAHTFTFFTECVVDYLIALSLESCAQIGIWFTRNAHRGTAGFDLHSQIFRFLLNRGMPEEKLLLLPVGLQKMHSAQPQYRRPHTSSSPHRHIRFHHAARRINAPGSLPRDG